METLNTDKIIDFWDWFLINNLELAPDKITDNSINELNNKILSLADLSWEIREGINKRNMLIISAGSNPDLFPVARKIISYSPKIEEWDFYHYKPAKNWDYKLSLKNYINFDKDINVNDWEYILFKFKDNTFDIVIKPNDISFLKDEDKYIIVDIVLENILGEDLSYSLIKNVEIVEDFKESEIKSKSSIKNLAKHILQLSENNPIQ